MIKLPNNDVEHVVIQCFMYSGDILIGTVYIPPHPHSMIYHSHALLVKYIVPRFPNAHLMNMVYK